MVTTVDVRIVPFQEKDSGGVLLDFNKIIAEIQIDGAVVWTKSVETDDTIESVCNVRADLCWEAISHATSHFDYVPDEEEIAA